MDERALTERLVTYDTSTFEGMQAAAGFVKGWLEARDVEVTGEMHNGRPVLAATVGPAGAPTVVFHGHLDVVPAVPELFEPRVDGDRLYGRGAYDMKGGLASMMCALHDVAAQERVRVHFLCVCDEESEEEDEDRGSTYLVAKGYQGDFAITGEPTDLHIGVQAKGVLVLRIEVAGTSAHGSTPWIGDNAVVRAIDVFRQIESLPFARESSDLFDRPSINLGRIAGGDAINRVPDSCVIDVDIRYLPGQDADAILDSINALDGATATPHLPPPSGDGRPRERLRPGARRRARRDRGQERRADLGRPPRRLGRHRLPRRGRARRGVRPHGRRAPRPRRMGVDPVAQPVSEGARGVRAAATCPSRRPRRRRASPAHRLNMLEEIPRPGIWKKLLIGAALVIFASAGATTVAAFHEVDKVVDAFKDNPPLKLGNQLADTDPGKPQTLMILGSDRRPKDNVEGGAGARSDTIMLVRLDPDKDATALMSLPRDLKVEIPGHGTDKINAAYDYGGPRLTLRTVKQLTGLSINHVVNVSFGGFWRAVNAVGCVYGDIDRRYYNDSAEFTYINVQPGYQRLCGRKALQYVRFRHEDNDLVRSARQQDFLRQAKQQVNASDLIARHDRLVKIFGRNTTTDEGLRSRSEVLRLLKLAVFSAGRPIREIHFEGLIGPSYVEASDERVKKLVDEFLQVEDTPGPRGNIERKNRPKRRKPTNPEAAGLEDATTYGREQAVAGHRAGPRQDACPCSSRGCAPRARSTPGRRASTGSSPTGAPTRPTAWSSTGPWAWASTTASRAPPGRTRRSSTTPPRRARSAAASTSCTTTATACGSWPGTRTRGPTGSRTRCSSPCPRRR